MKKIFPKYNSDERGVMTMEFMVMLPILLMWFAGTFVFFDAFHKWIKAMKATYVVSDMLSRQTLTDNQFILDLDGVFDTISQTRDEADTWMAVTHVQYIVDQNGAGRLDMLWSLETKTGTSYTGADADAKLVEIAPFIPTLVNGETMTVLQTFRPFNPVFNWVGLDGTIFRNRISAPQRFDSSFLNEDQETPPGSSLEGFDPTPEDPDP